MVGGSIIPPPRFAINANGHAPAKGEVVIVNSPVLGRAENIAYLYAIHTSGIESDVVEFSKQGGLVSQTVKTGDDLFGYYLSVGLPNRHRGTRYGTYTAQYIPGDGPVITRYGFIKPKTSVLDTRGVYTRTVWPAVPGGTRLASSPDNYIGVRWSPGCRSIQWCKGKQRNVNTGPRLQLTSTDDAGCYTIRRGKRGARGWFVQIKVIAAKVDIPKSRDFVLAVVGASALRCGDLPGGNPKCRGYLFCMGDLYGCKCASGWWGNNCDRPCPKGKWGVDCSQRCPDRQLDCDRFFGPDKN
ncbi:putative angiopoietin-1 receptor isoform X2 [Apostichopus japonicus]|uniref:Putative angiopoietin-1 receptor isoform X2 n=1 Tax=Stichopus japonicus TaxID=307972 RepID=A0A2G8JTD3_STIJA|nr:putative angiopoietin-1 receptor isoform X2 [Apostichopus japonicus]